MAKEKKFKTIFLGTPDFAVPALKALIAASDFEVVLVISQKDKKKGRKQIVTPPPVKEKAEKYNIPVIQPKKIEQAEGEIKKINPDFIAVAAYGQLIPQNILNIPKYGSFNVHASLLPKYRGAAVISAPILNGDSQAGITIIKMDACLDTGPILLQEKIILKKDETASSLHDKLSYLSAKILPQALRDYAEGKIKPKAQDDSMASFVKTLKKEDGQIDWQKSAGKIERTIRALNPWPGTYSHLGGKNIKIIEAQNKILKINKYRVGEVFLNNKKLAVQCGQDAIVIEKLQLEGKKAMTGEKFLRGQKDLLGSILK